MRVGQILDGVKFEEGLENMSTFSFTTVIKHDGSQSRAEFRWRRAEEEQKQSFGILAIDLIPLFHRFDQSFKLVRLENKCA